MAARRDAFLIFVLVSMQLHVHLSTVAEARPLPFVSQEGYVKVLETLGLRCQCCDGDGGVCRSVGGDATCSGKLHCNPWKY